MNTQPNYTYRDYDYPINLLLDLRMERTMPSVCTVHSDEYLTTLDGVLNTISARDRTALLCRYEQQMTLDEIGSRLNITGARAGQIVSKGLRLLRHPSRQKHLIAESEKDVTIEPEHSHGNTQPDDLQILALELSPRAKNCLLRGNMWTVNDVMDRSPEALGQIRGMGVTSYAEIITQLESLGCDMTAYREYMENWTYA